MPTTPFLNLFGRSPIRPLEEHMSKVHASVKLLAPFFAAVFKKNWPEVEILQKDIIRFENEADTIKRDLHLHLPKSLFMSVSRSDLLGLLNVQDRLANQAKDIAGIVTGRKINFPEATIPLFVDFLAQCIEASEQANVAIHELDELLETGFSGNEMKIVEDMIVKLSHIEHSTDDKQIVLRHIIFGLETSLPPIDVMFLYKIIEWTGDLANRAQDIGDRLQILLVR